MSPAAVRRLTPSPYNMKDRHPASEVRGEYVSVPKGPVRAAKLSSSPACIQPDASTLPMRRGCIEHAGNNSSLKISRSHGLMSETLVGNSCNEIQSPFGLALVCFSPLPKVVANARLVSNNQNSGRRQWYSQAPCISPSKSTTIHLGLEDSQHHCLTLTAAQVLAWRAGAVDLIQQQSRWRPAGRRSHPYSTQSLHSASLLNNSRVLIPTNSIDTLLVPAEAW
ncbi:hypothetical protein AC579_6928 [Pseudocercospora musae]|uniref:Uncharacterized protein n=1 Tax=Pseudocercospora musae TaxID=113226 RepID=A0A139IN91_9PEZI|nr:hypothetical protein AC579_6928 [Pseudocercospora musae]